MTRAPYPPSGEGASYAQVKIQRHNLRCPTHFHSFGKELTPGNSASATGNAAIGPHFDTAKATHVYADTVYWHGLSALAQSQGAGNEDQRLVSCNRDKGCQGIDRCRANDCLDSAMGEAAKVCSSPSRYLGIILDPKASNPTQTV